jgi:hypothetical protein
LSGIGDWTSADDGLRIGGRIAGVKLGIEFGKAAAIEAGIAGAAAGAGRVWLQLKPAHALDDIFPADRLSVFAVADHVDAELHLPAHHLDNRISQTGFVGRMIVRFVRLLGAHDFLQRRRANETADMRGQDAVAARSHGSLSNLLRGLTSR